jgi:hypothetical protein
VVPPGDRHLSNAVAKLARYEEDFHIEAEALQALPREHVPRDVAWKAFESALRITNTVKGNESNTPIEHTAHPLAPPRLSNTDVRQRQGSGSHSDVGALLQRQ